jgi:hypothetical protein
MICCSSLREAYLGYCMHTFVDLLLPMVRIVEELGDKRRFSRVQSRLRYSSYL